MKPLPESDDCQGCQALRAQLEAAKREAFEAGMRQGIVDSGGTAPAPSAEVK